MNWIRQNQELAGLILRWLSIATIVFAIIGSMSVYAYQTTVLIDEVKEIKQNVRECQIMHAEVMVMLKDHLEDE